MIRVKPRHMHNATLCLFRSYFTPVVPPRACVVFFLLVLFFLSLICCLAFMYVFEKLGFFGSRAIV